jgi:glutaminyl-tRNA synthetase
LVDAYGITDADAETFAGHSELTVFFEVAMKHHDNGRAIANWIINDVMRELKDGSLSALLFGGAQVAELVKLIDAGDISGKIAKTVFATMTKEGGSPTQIVTDKGLKQLTDPADVQPVVDRILAANEEAVAQYRGGKTNRMGFFVGQVIKETGGRANPQLVNQLLKKSLEG